MISHLKKNCDNDKKLKYIKNIAFSVKKVITLIIKKIGRK